MKVSILRAVGRSIAPRRRSQEQPRLPRLRHNYYDRPIGLCTRIDVLTFLSGLSRYVQELPQVPSGLLIRRLPLPIPLIVFVVKPHICISARSLPQARMKIDLVSSDGKPQVPSRADTVIAINLLFSDGTDFAHWQALSFSRHQDDGR